MRQKYTSVIFLILIMLSSSVIAVEPSKSILNCYFTSLNLKSGHTVKLTNSLRELREEKRKELEGLNYIDILPWKPKRRNTVTRIITEKTGTKIFLPSQPPRYMKNQPLGEAVVDANEIHYAQAQAQNLSQDPKYSVIGNARAIKEGKLDPSVLPKIRVWRDETGKIWSLDHRRLAAIRLSGVVKELKVEFVDEALVRSRDFKFSTRNEGRSIMISLENETGSAGNLSLVID